MAENFYRILSSLQSKSRFLYVYVFIIQLSAGNISKFGDIIFIILIYNPNP